MNKFFLLISFLFLVVVGFSQTGVRVYFKGDLETIGTVSDHHIYGDRNYDERGRGTTIYYRKDGSKFASFNEKKGKRIGEGVYFHENDYPSRIGNFKRDRPIGTHDYFDVSGVYIRSEIYDRRGKIAAEYYKTANDKKVFTVCDQLSSFGNYRKASRAFMEMGVFIDENLVRTALSKDMTEASVTVAFLIAPDGKLDDFEIIRSLNPLLNPAVLDVLKEMPAWKPAKYNGKAVYSEFSITVNF